jgi:hypothetical protein
MIRSFAVFHVRLLLLNGVLPQSLLGDGLIHILVGRSHGGFSVHLSCPLLLQHLSVDLVFQLSLSQVEMVVKILIEVEGVLLLVALGIKVLTA